MTGWLVAMFWICGCSTRSPVGHAVAPHPRIAMDGESGNAIANSAQHYLAHAPTGHRTDCSGFVEAVLTRAGVTHLAGSTSQLWELSVADGTVHRQLQPSVGDLAFFDNTYDRNQNGRLDDPLTHIAVVIAVDPDGTITMAHRGTHSGRSKLHMNLFHPHHDRKGEARLNDALRWPNPHAPGIPTLTGQLWRGFATVRYDAIAMGE